MPSAMFKIHDEAADELRQVTDWFLERSVDAARSFIAELDRALARILSNPGMGAHYLYGTRGVKLHRFRYVLVYKDVGDFVHVIAVAHTSRRKGYWRKRLHDIEDS